MKKPATLTALHLALMEKSITHTLKEHHIYTEYKTFPKTLQKAVPELTILSGRDHILVYTKKKETISIIRGGITSGNYELDGGPFNTNRFKTIPEVIKALKAIL
jgi:hypothetical protein